MSDAKQPGWFVVMSTDIRQLWLGWKGPLLLFAFSLFLSVNLALLANDPEINQLSQPRIINLTINEVILAGSITALLLGANAFSGERDRQSLESLLLTPTSRGQIVIGKLLAVLSLWLAMVPIAAPYILLAAKGTAIVTESLLVLVILGTCIVWISAGIGILFSGLAPTNMISFAASFVVMAILAFPTQLPGQVQDLPAIRWFIVTNPFTAVTKYQSAVLVDGEPWTSKLSLLISPLIALILIVGGGIYLLDRYLTLPGGLRARPKPQTAATLLLIGLLGMSLAPAPALAQGPASDGMLFIEISKTSAALTAGEWVEFDTVLHNDSAEVSPPLVAHLNITAVRKGPYVDPEDWSEERTQYVAPLQPGESVKLAWRVHGLIDGYFAAFVTVLSSENSFIPVVSMPLQLRIEPNSILPMKDVIPVVTIVPMVPLALLVFGAAAAWRRGAAVKS